MFVIAAFDTNGKQRTTGGDAFDILAAYEDDDAADAGIPTTIRDNENGTYSVKVSPHASTFALLLARASCFRGDGEWLAFRLLLQLRLPAYLPTCLPA